MTNEQLYLAIGIPVAFNLGSTVIILMYVSTINRRLDDLKDLWRAELKRVEEVLDARLKHMEERS